ncbi:Translation initiation factor eIF-2B subunit gamma [Dimargaris cristalligena]|uniref:Translation initiation factor eIF2B subunit gamma n=1 Tax=Dimargaris cristalligena TaxID=215637 RepID=A0A4P9ZQ04_9FUNG|nr:Translation initiation factor eIF-2B subunit gamma [Dimargaris cristalligena]RKP34791.1 nucleotide-diphospho-sugar transferase [Dimargaris cristalligena]|eukprot:RKP34791.1 nucleotide-diphospho-sugar transferase [Dimargaris cristalligena]
MFSLDQTTSAKPQVVLEFQAIILAGNQGNIYPLAADDNLPKALLPIANRPMIAYPLQWLEATGIQNIIVAICSSSEAKLTHYLRNVYEGSAHIDIVTVDEHFSTAEVLRYLAPRIFQDFIVLPCDAVANPQTAYPQRFLDSYRSANPALTALFYEPPKSEGGGGSTKDSEWPLYVGLDATQQRLLYMRPGDRVKEALNLRMPLLRKFTRLNLVTHLQDAHIYVCKKWILDLVVQKKELTSFQKDVLPLLVRAQCRPSLLETEGISAIMDAARQRHKYNQSVHEWSTTVADDPMEPELRVNLYIASSGFMGRADSVPHYCDLNKHASRLFPDDRVAKSAEINSRSQIGADSMVGNLTKVDERTSVKKSVIGAHCVIGKNVKIVNSVLMDYITVEDGAKLDGCVICNNAKIQAKAQLKDCEVGASLVVDPETQAKNERIVSSFIPSGEEGMQVNFG